jgi:hypothetical protein
MASRRKGVTNGSRNFYGEIETDGTRRVAPIAT